MRMRRVFPAAAAFVSGVSVLAAQGLTMGPADRPAVDAAAADRGRAVWAAECITCHGTQARGTDNGPNLVRSEIVLHDRNGSEIGPFLKRGHQTAERQAERRPDRRAGVSTWRISSASASTTRCAARRSSRSQDILTGNADGGPGLFQRRRAAARRATPTTRQSAGHRLAPREPGGSPAADAVSAAGARSWRGARRHRSGPRRDGHRDVRAPGAPLDGVLVQMDDFYVTFRDAAGAVRVVATRARNAR